MSLSGDQQRNDRKEEARPAYHMRGGRPLPSNPKIEEVIARGESIELTSQWRELSNEQLATEIDKLAAYGVANNTARDLLFIAAGRLAKINVELDAWRNFVDPSVIADPVLVDIEQIYIGTHVTYHVLDNKEGVIHVYTAEADGTLISKKVMSKGVTSEFMQDLHNRERERRNY